MKYLNVLVLVCLTGQISYAQDSLAVKYAATISAAELKGHLMELASDAYEGRDTGSEGQRKAAAYIAAYFDSLGIAPCVDGSYFQHFPLKKQSARASELKSGNKTYAFIDDFFFFPGFEDGDYPIDQVVFAGYGVETEGYNDYDGIDPNNKIVLVFSGEPKDKKGNYIVSGSNKPSDWDNNYRMKRDVAQAKGARTLIVIPDDYKLTISRAKYWLENPGMSLDMERDEKKDIIPTFFISAQVADALLKQDGRPASAKLRAKLEKKGKPASFDFTAEGVISARLKKDKLQSENVLAYIEGGDLKEELVVITAHYDHVGRDGEEIFNGADDDGSGTVSVLELAEAFMMAKEDGNGPRRSVLLMTVSGEEKGLLGSEWYSEFPVFPMENTVANLNIDMIGRVDEKHKNNSNYIYLIGSDKLSTELHAISEEANATYTGLELDYTYNDPKDPNRFYYRSDHYNFARNGIPVIFYFSGVHEDYHRPTDTPDRIMYDKMVPIVQLIFHTAWDLANREKRIVVDVENEFAD